MKAIGCLQVLLLVAMLAYLAAYHLANRGPVAYPAPWGGGRGAPSLGLLSGFLAGLAYASLLYLPPLLRRRAALGRLRRRARELEAENARLGGPAAPADGQTAPAGGAA